MIKWLLLVLFLIVLYLVIYLLYCSGIAVMKCIAAAEFIFFRGKDADRTSLSSCTGTVRHMCRLCEGGVYEYKLDSELTSGSVELILTDRKKQQVLKLDSNNTVGKAEIDINNRYYLQWKFKKAFGKCELHWQQISENVQ